ncbi:hypothetical protein [Reinekea marinisedimentorum]|uniref:Cell division inhibitor SulA n=1 Tax=Reinekea marinisedimentorum TaxID=230495 RepID=A0A4R3I8K5_9GAMM|nr:hypothetical protein [Reinekea marinisedimentorum]TCS42602.1 hypothetical protein BCF53_103266 [Reinekea marinisedimentorum]
MLTSAQSVSNPYPPVHLVTATGEQQVHSICAPLFTQWHRLLGTIKNTDRKQWITLINPPFKPDDRFLEASGLGHCYFRIVILKEHNPSTLKYIRQSMLNGKSSLVAAWLNSEDMAREFQDVSHCKCKTLLFCRDQAIGAKDPQLELAI